VPTEGTGTDSNAPYRQGLLADLSGAVVAYFVSTFGFSPHGPASAFNPAGYKRIAYRSVFRSRVLGRELVLLVYDHLPASWLGSHFANLPVPGPGQLYAAFVIVNGAAFLLFVLCLHSLLKKYWAWEPQRTMIVAAGVLVAAFGSYAVTAYDQISYALLLLFALLVLARTGWVTALSVPIGVLGVLNRESMLLGLALVAGLATAYVAGEPQRAKRLAGVLAANGAAMAITYVGLRIASGGSGRVFAGVILGTNLRSLNSWIGVAIVVLGYPVWWRFWGVLGLTSSRRARVALINFYLFSLPYLLVIFFTGLWSEVRLIVPLLLCEIVIRLALADPPMEPQLTSPGRVEGRDATREDQLEEPRRRLR
jgi:hypothetical protein